MTYPTTILKNIYWSFQMEPIHSMAEFETTVKAYNEEITEDPFIMDLNEVILTSSKVVFQYLFYGDNEDSEEPQILIESDNHINFTAIELLYKIHQNLCEKLIDEELCYFEGLAFLTDTDPDFPNVPVYAVILGS